jgi:LPS sulfotransferase NodH
MHTYRKKLTGILLKSGIFSCGAKVETRFFILGSPRSGSNLLRTHLQSHENVRIYPEIFNLFSIPKDDLNEILTDPRKYLDDFFNKKYPGAVKALGFKIFYNQATAGQLDPDFYARFHIREVGHEMHNKINSLQKHIREKFEMEAVKDMIESVWSYLEEDKKLKIIHLTRKNKLKQYLSLVRAWQSDQWTSKSGNAGQQLQPVRIEYADCLGFFKMAAGTEEKFSVLFKDHAVINIAYEDFCRDLHTELIRIQSFLNLPLKPLEADLTKQRVRSISSSIANYRELKNKFTKSEWEPYFDE